jgi:hypothetical protein
MQAYMDDTETGAGTGSCVLFTMSADNPGHSYTAAKSTLRVRSASELSSSTDTYVFAIEGEKFSLTPERGGGVLGIAWDTYWGCLAYTASGGVEYGGYFNGGIVEDGSGKQVGAGQGVGFGSYGGVLGGWARGDIYGLYVSGIRYASYTDGNSFTNGYQATLHDVGGFERVATFTPTSVDVDVYAHGVGELVNGKSEITFDARFIELVSDEIPVTVTVTPRGIPSGVLCLTDESSESFSVELVEIPGMKGSKDVTFSWIAVGRRAGFESRPEVPEELRANNFDANMREFAHNEGDMNSDARPMWFDGVSIRWDTPPEIPMSEEMLKKREMDRLEHEALEAEHRRMLDE